MCSVLDSHCTNCNHQQCLDCSEYFEELQPVLERDTTFGHESSSSSMDRTPKTEKPTLAEASFPARPPFDTPMPSTAYDPFNEYNTLQKDALEIWESKIVMNGQRIMDNSLEQQGYHNHDDGKNIGSSKEPLLLAPTIPGMKIVEKSVESEPEFVENTPLILSEASPSESTGSETSEFQEEDEEFHHYQATLSQESSHNPAYFTTMVLERWLESLQDNPNYDIIASVCGDILQHQPVDGDSAPAQSASVPSSSSRSSQSNGKRHKRKASQLDGNNGSDSTGEPSTTKTPRTNINRKPKYACHFWKMNQHLYAECRNTGYSQICHLTDHLRKEHSLGNTSCRRCWRRFGDDGALIAHNIDTGESVCRATGGTPINKLKISKKSIGDYQKWFWIWEQFFPLFQRPESPYWESLNHDEQLLSHLERSMSAQLSQHLSADNVELVMTNLAMFRERWITNPPEPRSLAPLPLPTGTQDSDDAEQPNSQVVQSPQIRSYEEVYLGTHEYEYLDAQPSNDDRFEFPTEDPSVDLNTWEYSQNYDACSMYDPQPPNPSGIDNPDNYEWP
ncbi:hypothetical protein F5Y02DRAFT_424674 [Annulohypoxylon stygium]|nr:hypothetical protein F5Y02DRAFT_424674 [Annulohypoxylon stygium]